jgi:hypothetical protein
MLYSEGQIFSKAMCNVILPITTNLLFCLLRSYFYLYVILPDFFVPMYPGIDLVLCKICCYGCSGSWLEIRAMVLLSAVLLQLFVCMYSYMVLISMEFDEMRAYLCGRFKETS